MLKFILWLFILCLNVFASNAEAKKLKIALALWRGETLAEKGFQNELKDYGYDLEISIFDAKQDRSTMGSHLRSEVFKNKKFDYIYSFGTTVTGMVKNIVRGKFPHIFNIVADPVGAGFVDSLEKTGGNISGVKNGPLMSKQILVAHNTLKFKKLGFIYNPQEMNSTLTLKELRKQGAKVGFAIKEFRLNLCCPS